MTVLITLSEVGSDAGPSFDLYASPDGITFTSIVEGIDKTDLEAGYEATVPDGTTDIKVTSVGQCTSSHVATIGAGPTISGSLCGYWTSYVYPMTPPNTENRIDGYIDFSSQINSESIDPANSWVRVTHFETLYGGGSTIPDDSSGDLTFTDYNNRGYISEASIVVFQVDDPSAAMTLYFEGYITTYEGTTYVLYDTYSNYTSMNGINTIGQC
jgi:hypothetical protein